MNMIPLDIKDQSWLFNQQLVVDAQVLGVFEHNALNLGIRSENIQFSTESAALKDYELQLPDWQVTLVELIGATKLI
ncbi:hypothetical protein, partial [Lactobacillus gasseri]